MAHYRIGFGLFSTLQKINPYRKSFSSLSPPGGELQEKILSKALSLVPTYGWIDSLPEACRQVGLSSLAFGNLFPGSSRVAVISHYMQVADSHMKLRIQESLSDFEKLGMTDKIRFASWERLKHLQPFVSSWTQAVAIMIEPSHISESFEFLGNTVDQLWHSCGDTSVDMQCSELYMTQDKSPDFIHTKEFLDRQLDNAMSFGHVSTQLLESMSFYGEMWFKFMLPRRY